MDGASFWFLISEVSDRQQTVDRVFLEKDRRNGHSLICCALKEMFKIQNCPWNYAFMAQGPNGQQESVRPGRGRIAVC
jgi:hypothetical protein